MRCSATAEDLPEAAFAGQQDTPLPPFADHFGIIVRVLGDHTARGDANPCPSAAWRGSKLSEFALPWQPKDLALSPRTNRLYLASLWSGEVLAMDAERGQVLNSVKLIRPAAGRRARAMFPGSLVVDPGQNRLYVGQLRRS